MQMILGEVGGITEQAYIKLLTSLTSEGPDQQKKTWSLRLPASHNWTTDPISRSLSQGYFSEKVHVVIQLFPQLVSAYHVMSNCEYSASPCAIT